MFFIHSAMYVFGHLSSYTKDSLRGRTKEEVGEERLWDQVVAEGCGV